MAHDLKQIISLSNGIGAWETNKKSLAYTPRKLRKTYVHGAIWFGKRDAFIHMCGILSKRTQLDLERSVIAKWHDESHLNWYVANHKVTVLDNRFSGVKHYKHLKGLPAYITSVDKQLTVRLPTNFDVNEL
jgi:hypothetical protein